MNKIGITNLKAFIKTRSVSKYIKEIYDTVTIPDMNTIIDKSRMSLLMAVCSESNYIKNYKIAKELILLPKINVNIQNAKGQTVLMMCIESIGMGADSEIIIELLTRKDLDMSIVDNAGLSIKDYAMRQYKVRPSMRTKKILMMVLSNMGDEESINKFKGETK